MKGDAQSGVRILAALSAFEEVLLDVLENWEERAAFLIADDVPIRAGNTADEGSCDDSHYLWWRLSDEWTVPFAREASARSAVKRLKDILNGRGVGVRASWS